jgi:diphosphomevalonate decarboxylase
MQVCWQSPSNIALVKYWGKHGNQLPDNASLSLTLSKAVTQTSVALEKTKSKKNLQLHFLFEGSENEKFSEKIGRYITSLTDDFPWLIKHKLLIETKNSFPHSTGIASSASAMSALALCLLSLDEKMTGRKKKDFFRKASHFARLGSGSAARSVYGGFALWGKCRVAAASSNKYAIAYPKKFDVSFEHLHDAILIVSRAEKKVSSTAGHALMRNHSMKKQRYKNAYDRLLNIVTALKQADWEMFCETTEAEALELHALMMTSSPPYILMQPQTLAIIEKVRRFRQETKTPLCFTLDAGPNVHVLYPDSVKQVAENFINSELLSFCHENTAIHDTMGAGPIQLMDA